MREARKLKKSTTMIRKKTRKIKRKTKVTKKRKKTLYHLIFHGAYNLLSILSRINCTREAYLVLR